ncbi:MAG: serine hydrolase [Bacteroidia bacterium]
MKSIIHIITFLFLLIENTSVYCQTSNSQENENKLIENIIKSYSPEFKFILENQKKYQVQIIYTQINRDKNNIPSFKQYSYQLNAQNYFYAASLVKLPCSALALEKLNKLNIAELDKNSIMVTDSAFGCQKKTIADPTTENGKPSVANYIKRMLLVSDNDAYSRIYEFLGQEYIYQQLVNKGYTNARITHRFDAACNTEQNKYTNPIEFYNSNNKLIYRQPMQISKIELKNPYGTVKKGKAYIDKKNKLISEPKDYTQMNYLSLQDINDILKTLLFPESVEKEKRFDLKEEDYTFLYNYLSMYPRESTHPSYNPKEFEDSYKKYLMYGTYHKKIENDSIRIFNIVGQSYGDLSDCAYIINPKKGIEFMLSAVIYVNENEIINDGKYEYKTIGFPFFTAVGQAIYKHEHKRKKEYLPDLSNFERK